jgi:hypothetical protein
MLFTTDMSKCQEGAPMRLPLCALCFIILGCNSSFGQDIPNESAFSGPTKEVTFRVLLLIESEDANRITYNGPAREGLTAAGYGRLIPAGSAIGMASIGQHASVTGSSRYGQMSVQTTLLNTTEQGTLQIKISLQTDNRMPISIDTTAKSPLGRWFLVGGAESRIGLPTHANDGMRAVAIMRIDDGIMLLD